MPQSHSPNRREVPKRWSWFHQIRTVGYFLTPDFCWRSYVSLAQIGTQSIFHWFTWCIAILILKQLENLLLKLEGYLVKAYLVTKFMMFLDQWFRAEEEPASIFPSFPQAIDPWVLLDNSSHNSYPGHFSLLLASRFILFLGKFPRIKWKILGVGRLEEWREKAYLAVSHGWR